ncbi:MAG: YggS family pyridoxal phosphate-dependent enzyme [Cyanobacteria bacterium REEB67]|nr:YggS family pyridoxal phosphate-dependent enzyme [Cyanobacteria bacterium REEB67]
MSRNGITYDACFKSPAISPGAKPSQSFNLDEEAHKQGMGISKVAQNLAVVRETLSDRPVKLIAVTKHATIDQITEAHNLGVSDFGENRLQDALKKRTMLPPQVALQSTWHFIGHLQSNKVKQAVGNFSLIHSVDSFRLLEEVARVASQKGTTQRVLLQVKIVRDDAKSGFSIQELKEAMPEILKLESIKVEGLMTITPFDADIQTSAVSFNGLRLLRDELNATYGTELKELSMGMSDDWQQAISCGSTMIRLGRAIFDS